MKSKSFRIAIIDPVGSKAGMDHYDTILAEGIRQAGSASVVFSNYPANDASGIIHQTFHNTGKGKYASLLRSLSGMKSSLDEARDWKADFILLHVFRGGLIDFLFFLMVRMYGFRIIALVHDVESLESYSLPLFRRTVLGQLSTLRIVHNAFSREQLFHTLQPSNRYPVTVIPHVHFLSLFSNHDKSNRHSSWPAELVKPSGTERITLLFFGQIKRSKGLDVLLEAMRDIPDHIHLIIAGKTRDTDPLSIKRSIDDAGLASRVQTVLRHISDAERDTLFNTCDILVLPYRRIYQSGVLLMGMSAGIPVVASDLEPNRDAVIHEGTGLLFQSGNAAALRDSLMIMASDKAIRNRYSEQARMHIRESHDPLKAARLLIDALNQLPPS
jgi:D-inositol-3-phosphate glycosyltransferase